MPNAWDAGSAKLFASLGFPPSPRRAPASPRRSAAATAAVTREEAIAHTAALAAATPLPVNADLEDCFADDPAGVAATITAAAAAGTAGASVEDYEPHAPIHPTRRWPPSASPPRSRRPGRSGVVLTARAENLIRGVRDLADTIRRLQAYQEAGADVLYAPGLFTIDDVRSVVSSVDRPVNVLLLAGGPAVPALAERRRRPHLRRRGAGVGVVGRRRRRRPSELLSSGTHGLRRPRQGRRRGGARPRLRLMPVTAEAQ